MGYALLVIALIALLELAAIANGVQRLADHHERFPPPFAEPDVGEAGPQESDPESGPVAAL